MPLNRLDFSRNGRFLIAACEFDGTVMKVDVATRSLISTLHLPAGAMAQDVRLSRDGRLFYIADMMANGVHEVDGVHARRLPRER